MKIKKIGAISGIVILAIVVIAAAQPNSLGKSLESFFAEKAYSQIEDYDVRDVGGTISLSIKTNSDLPNSNEDFERARVISFGYAWLRPNNDDGSFAGVFSNVHTIGGFIGPWHSELVRLVPKDENSYCLLFWPIVNEVSAGNNLVRTILSEDQLDFSPRELDTAVSAVIVENLSCDSGFEAKVINELKKG